MTSPGTPSYGRRTSGWPRSVSASSSSSSSATPSSGCPTSTNSRRYSLYIGLAAAVARGYTSLLTYVRYGRVVNEPELTVARRKYTGANFFFTPIPCTYTSLPLDGIFFLHGYARACNSSCLGPFNSYLLIPEERRKTFGLCWNRTQVLLLHKRPL